MDAPGTPKRDVIVVGASAGGVEALSALVADIPKELAASVFVVLHISSEVPSVLPQILSRRGNLPASHPQDGDRLRPGQVYVAPTDRHLVFEDDVVRVVGGPKENGHRPAIDPLFRSAAKVYGSRVIGVILSGTRDDGAAGLRDIKQAHGLAIVQSDARHQEMPRRAQEAVDVDHAVPLHEIGPLLVRLVGAEAPDVPAKIPVEPLPTEDMLPPGSPSVFSCPECGGVLWEVPGDRMARFRCRVGHAYSESSLMADQHMNLEALLWSALRALEERADLLRRVAARTNREEAQVRLKNRAHAVEHEAQSLRALLHSLEPDTEEPAL